MSATKRADAVVIGDRLDLEGDRYADPESENVSHRHEYAEVMTRDLETPECVALGGDGWWVGFPVAHLVKLAD